MPIYEYRCDECQQLFEEWCKHIEENNVAHSCPICRGQAHRIISNTSFALKGGGWYVTEYGSRKSDNASTQCSDTASCSGVSGDTAPASAATPPAQGCSCAPATDSSKPATGTVSS